MKNYKQIPDNVVLQATIIKNDGETETREMRGIEYNNIISWIPVLRSIGGSETVLCEYHRKYGYKVVQTLVSRSPKGTTTIYIFKFKDDVSMKKYDVTIKLFTGSYNTNGSKCYNEVARVKSNSIDYIYKVYRSKINEADRRAGYGEIQDNNGRYSRDMSNM